MRVTTPVPNRPPLLSGTAHRRAFSMHGVGISVVTDLDDAVTLLDETFGEFAAPAGPEGVFIEVLRSGNGDGFLVTGADGGSQTAPDAHAALLAMLNAVAGTVVSGLYRQGLLAIHAGALVHRGRALVIAGRSGHGKTTLTLALVRAGLAFLSDELAVLDPATRTVHAYPRSAHVRPTTLALIPELEPLCGRAQRDLGDGNEWVVTPRELATAFPGCRATAAPLGAVILLDAPADAARSARLSPVPPGVATLELLRGTPAASIDFGAVLPQMAGALGSARCARLDSGELTETVAAVLAWLDEDGDG
jgi:hypothetical protein